MAKTPKQKNVAEESAAITTEGGVVDSAPITTEGGVVEDAVTTSSARIASLLTAVQGCATAIKDITTTLKVLQKEVTKLEKAAAGKKRVATAGANGFSKPIPISAELCVFLGLPNESTLSRNDVTKLLNAYIKENALQDTTDKRVILPNERLSSITKLEDGQKLTFFTLQRAIKHHFL